MSSDPHAGQPVLDYGIALEKATGAIILLHGRGGSAEDILGLADEIGKPGLAYLAPQAASNSWYPNSFMAPVEQNQPWVSSALKKVDATLKSAVDKGIPVGRIAICGFSQGACLATEFVASYPRQYAGLIAFTGGLIGPPDADLKHDGDLQGMLALFASGDPDPHVPWARVQKSAEILTGMNAVVTIRRYPGRPHTVSRDELEQARALIEQAFAS